MATSTLDSERYRSINDTPGENHPREGVLNVEGASVSQFLFQLRFATRIERLVRF